MRNTEDAVKTTKRAEDKRMERKSEEAGVWVKKWERWRGHVHGQDKVRTTKPRGQVGRNHHDRTCAFRNMKLYKSSSRLTL
jgi:hypothetical protein